MKNLRRHFTGILMVGALVLAFSGCGGSNNPSITSTTIPDAKAGTPYSVTLTETGGLSPYSWSVSSGALPAGLTLSSNGIVSGTPSTSGSTTFSVALVDSNGFTATQSFTMIVDLPSSLGPGMSIVLTSGQSILVPSGTTVTTTSNMVTVNGDNDTIKTTGGASISVPTTATGTADNSVTAQ